jgi:hypothetical protein
MLRVTQTDVFKEKRKWQIAFRRYVLEKQANPKYAPYFGLDVNTIRLWFEGQFAGRVGWEDFGQKWQFEHIVPLNYFNFNNVAHLKLGWHFTNIKVSFIEDNRVEVANLLKAKQYFHDLFLATNYQVCDFMLKHIETILEAERLTINPQQAFINQYITYLNSIISFNSFEFELLNAGKTIAEVKKEAAFIKKFA